MHKEELAKGGKLHHVDLDIDPAWQTAKCCHRREEEGRGQGRRRGGWVFAIPYPPSLPCLFYDYQFYLRKSCYS